MHNYDVVAFTVHAPEGRKIFNSRVAIDVGVPAIGEEIAVLTNNCDVTKLGGGHGTVEQRFEMRFGVVTEVIMGSEGLLGPQSFCFRTTVPVLGTMSGSPVIKKPEQGATVVAVGVVSSDHSVPEAFSSFLVAGYSTASMLWPAMGLGLDVAVPPDPARHHFLIELLEKGLLDNRSERVSVVVRQLAGEMQIHYLDERRQPPSGAILTTTGHPRFSGHPST